MNQPYRERELRFELSHLRGEFLEMPGLRLTVKQAAKLTGVHVDIAAELLLQLVQTGFLRETRGGYMRTG